MAEVRGAGKTEAGAAGGPGAFRGLYGEWDQYLRIGFDDSGMPSAELRHHGVKIVAYQDGEDDDLLHVEVHADETVPIRHDSEVRRKLWLNACDLQVRANGPNQFVIESLWADVTVTYNTDEANDSPYTTVVIDGHASVERHAFDSRYL